jgi:hypothetical protein
VQRFASPTRSAGSAIVSLVRTAKQRLRSQGTYRAELTEWTQPPRGRRDGVPPQAFGRGTQWNPCHCETSA